jgi:DNA-binding GntR family transcriptional regulator
MDAPLTLQRPQSLTDMADERLRAAIVDGELQLGEQVSEAQLARRLGVSKTPVREALMRLAADGLVEVHPQRGTFVFRLEARQVSQLCRYRATIETAALREAMASRRTSLARELAARVKAMARAHRAKDASALAALDMDFHWQLLAHCDNPYLHAGYGVIRWQLLAMRHRAPISNSVPSHQVLVEAVQADDVERACTLLSAHVLENEARYSAVCGAG